MTRFVLVFTLALLPIAAAGCPKEPVYETLPDAPSPTATLKVEADLPEGLRCELEKAAREGRTLLTERRQRVDRSSADAELEVEVRAGRVPGGADEAEALPRCDALAEADVDARQVRVHGADAI